MRLKDKQIQFWYLLPNSKELRKFEIDVLPLIVFMSFFFLFLFGFFAVGFFSSSSAITQTKKHFAYMLGDLKLRNLKNEKEFLERKNTYLETELAKILDANKKISEYEINISKRNKELADLIENTTKIDIAASSNLVNVPKAPIGGLEKDTNSSADKNLIKDSFNIENFDDLKRQELIKQMDKINKMVQVLPIGLPLKSNVISSNFGIRRSPFTGKIVKHLGIDFSAKYGVPVHSTGKGVVVKAKYSNTYGYMVDIRHKKNVISRYAHLSKILVPKGKIISRGDIIGLVGSTGRSTGNHLHYEVKVNKKSVNPISFIQLANYLDYTTNSVYAAQKMD